MSGDNSSPAPNFLEINQSIDYISLRSKHYLPLRKCVGHFSLLLRSPPPSYQCLSPFPGKSCAYIHYSIYQGRGGLGTLSKVPLPSQLVGCRWSAPTLGLFLVTPSWASSCQNEVGRVVVTRSRAPSPPLRCPPQRDYRASISRRSWDCAQGYNFYHEPLLGG